MFNCIQVQYYNTLSFYFTNKQFYSGTDISFLSTKYIYIFKYIFWVQINNISMYFTCEWPRFDPWHHTPLRNATNDSSTPSTESGVARNIIAMTASTSKIHIISLYYRLFFSFY